MTRRATPEFNRNRKQLLADSPRCHWCKKAPATDADHLVPYDAGGSDDLDNLVPACKPCNSKRGAAYVNNKRAHQQIRRAEALGLTTTRKPEPLLLSLSLSLSPPHTHSHSFSLTYTLPLS